MTVTVQLWGQCSRIAGQRELRVELADGATIVTLLLDIYARWPQLAALDKSLLAAVGVEWVARDHVLKDGDKVSLAPPVAGG